MRLARCNGNKLIYAVEDEANQTQVKKKTDERQKSEVHIKVSSFRRLIDCQEHTNKT